MKQITTKGIVISDKAYKETSKILTIITEDKGIITVLAQGVKKLKSALKNVCDRFSYAEFNINYKEDKLSILTDGSIINPFFNIKKDIFKISYVNYICELSYQVLKQSNDKNIFKILIDSILKIEEGFDAGFITNILELKYLRYLGVYPMLDGCVICKSENVVTLSSYKGGFVCKNHIDDDYIVSDKTIKLIKMLEFIDIAKISKIDVSDNVKKEIDTFIMEYYERYTGLYLKSKDFLNKINI